MGVLLGIIGGLSLGLAIWLLTAPPPDPPPLSLPPPDVFAAFLRGLSPPMVALHANRRQSVLDLVQSKLRRAGLAAYLDAPHYLAGRACLLALAPAVVFHGLLAWSFLAGGANVGLALVMALVSAPAAGGACELWLWRRAVRHRRRIHLELASLLQMVAMAEEAGMEPGRAIARARELLGPSELTAQLDTALQEIQVGRRASDAVRDMAHRLRADGLTAFAVALAHSETLGAPIAPTLSAIAEQLWTEYIEETREMTLKTPVKLLIPMVLFLLPALMILIMGPSAVVAMKALSAAGFY